MDWPSFIWGWLVGMSAGVLGSIIGYHSAIKEKFDGTIDSKNT